MEKNNLQNSQMKQSVQVNKSEFKNNLSNVRTTLKNLENSNFFSQILELEKKSNFLSEHSENLEKKLFLIGVENDRLNMLRENLNHEKKLLFNQIEYLKKDFNKTMEDLNNSLENKKKEYNKLFLEYKNKNDLFKKEKSEFLSRIHELETIEDNLENKLNNLSEKYNLEKNEKENLLNEKNLLIGNIKDMENSFNFQLQNLKKDHENSFKQQENFYLQKITTEKKIVFDNQKKIYDNEKENLVKSYNVLLNEKNTEIQNLSSFKKESLEENGNLNIENQKLNKVIIKLERLIEEKDQDILNIEKNNERKITDVKKNLNYQQEILITKIKDDSKLKYSKMSSNFENDLKNLKKKLIDAENEGQFYKNEKEYLEENAEDIRLKNEKLQKDLHSLRLDYENEIEELTQQIDIYRRTYIDPKEYEIKFLAERSSYQAQITQLTAKMEQGENKNLDLLKENEKLQKLSLERLKDIERFKNNLNSLGDNEEVEEFQNEIKNLKLENNYIIEENLKLKSEKNVLNLKIKSYEDEKNAIFGENNELKNYLNLKKIKINQLEDSIRNLKKKTRNLLLEKNESESNILIMKEKNHNITSNFEGIIRERDHYKKSLENSEEQLLMLNKELTTKFHELEVVKKKYLNACNDFDQQSQVNLEKKSVMSTFKSINFNGEDDMDFR